ncbi:hypothetical protein [Streptomyces sp. NPDC057557]|uniref:hypothetical protein n=1 Tax=Streptomyces sp. NPDC057557 TaxID=3346167 RepID=UPI0036A1D2F9
MRQLVTLLGEEGEYQWWRFRIHARGRDAASAVGDICAKEGGTVVEQHSAVAEGAAAGDLCALDQGWSRTG